ncbi:MAG: PaaX family transcriptional regulator C-terminal domain-containing protein [Acidimicrobiales bacterium]
MGTEGLVSRSTIPTTRTPITATAATTTPLAKTSGDGRFDAIVYEVPETERAFRDRLRRSAQLLGYASLRPGLMVSASDSWEDLMSVLSPPTNGCQLYRAQLALSESDSAHLAARLWNLDDLASRYRGLLCQTQALIATAGHEPPIGVDALRGFAAATLPLFEATAADPDLPSELLPPNWPGRLIGRALGRAFSTFGAPLGMYLESLGIPGP